MHTRSPSRLTCSLSLQLHWTLGRYLLDPVEAISHLRQAIPVFEESGAVWEIERVRNALRDAENAIVGMVTG